MQKVLEKPSSKNWNGSFGKATLGSPRMSFHDANLLKGPLLSQWLVNDFKPRCFAPCCAGYCSEFFLSHAFSCGSNLIHNSILQTPKMPWHGFQSQSRVNSGCTITRHCFKGGHHCLHLVTVVFVSSINLDNNKKVKQK